MKWLKPIAMGLLFACQMAVASSSWANEADPDDDVILTGVRAHLFYERSGALSEDLLGRDPPFIGWNTPIGSGDAAEPAENLLVVATLENPGDEAWLDEKVTLRVTDEMDGEVKERVFSGLLFGAKSRLYLPLWLDDAGCLGPVTITAAFREKKISAPLQLMCGE